MIQPKSRTREALRAGEADLTAEGREFFGCMTALSKGPAVSGRVYNRSSFPQSSSDTSSDTAVIKSGASLASGAAWGHAAYKLTIFRDHLRYGGVPRSV